MSLMIGLIFSSLTMDSMSAFEDPFNLGDHQEDVEKITVTRTSQIRVTRPWRSSTRIRWKFFESMTRTSRGDQAFSSWPESFQVAVKVVIATKEEFRVVPIAKNGGLVVTILQTAGRYTGGMRDILRALYIMSVHSKDALLCRAWT